MVIYSLIRLNCVNKALLEINISNSDRSTLNMDFINKWFDILYTTISALIFVSWPERVQLLKTMLTEFRKIFWECVMLSVF